MHIKFLWNYANKGLLAILSVLVISTLASIVYLTYALISLNSLITQGGNAVGTAFVLQDLLINLQEAESGPRGYVITGDQSFLKEYEKALERIPADIELIKSSPQPKLSDERVARIESLVKDKLTINRQTVESRRNQNYDVAAAVVQSNQDSALMDGLRKEIATASSERLRNLGPRQQQSQENLRRALIVAGALSVLVLATCATLVWYFQRAILRERALESTKSEFLSLASHQLRTPATNVKQYIGLLLDGYMGDMSDQQRHALQVAYKNNESEINIMNDLLDVAKLDLSRIQLHKKVTNVTLLARHIVEDYQKAVRERGQTLSLVAPREIMAKVDGGYVKGVIENLVDNAVKYSRDGTRIIVRLSRDQDYLHIAVKDHGLGIKKRDLGKLFNKFSRLDNEFSTSTQGSGLGLYWVKQIVDLHGGDIEVVSKEGRGSMFTVRLPVR